MKEVRAPWSRPGSGFTLLFEACMLAMVMAMPVAAAADVFVMPSLSEGLPLARLEALAAGKPIVASEVGGITQVTGENRGVLW